MHAICVGCEIFNGPHLTKDCHLDDNENRRAQVCYSSGDRFDEDWRKTKKNGCPMKSTERKNKEKYKQTGRGFFPKTTTTT